LRHKWCTNSSNTLQHAATHYNTLQHHIPTCQCARVRDITHSTLCNALQHTATHCNTTYQRVSVHEFATFDKAMAYEMHWWIGWRRHIRCLESQVIFDNRATNYRALLREMTCEDKACYGSWPPCTRCAYCLHLVGYMKESCHISTCQCVAACCSVLQCVAYEGVVSHINVSVCTSCVTWLTCHTSMSHVTCHMSHINESCHISTCQCARVVWRDWVMSHINESHEWVMSHINESCHISTCQCARVVLHDSFICDMTHWWWHVTCS